MECEGINLKGKYERHNTSCEQESTSMIEYREDDEQIVKHVCPKHLTMLKLYCHDKRLVSKVEFKVPPPSPFPHSRLIRENSVMFCKKCGSSKVRMGWLGLFGEFSCIQPKCSEHKTK